MPLFSPKEPHFFQPLLPGFLKSFTIPVAFFSKYIKGNHENKTATLKSGLCSTWIVKMDGRRFTDGWEEFAVAHDYRIGDFLVFKHEGDMIFHVSAFGPSFCPLRYEEPKIHGDVATEQNVKKTTKKEADNVPTIQKKKESIKTELESSSDESCFVARVTESNLRNDTVHLPQRFVDRIDLSNRRTQMVLMNEQGRSWGVDLRRSNACGRKRAFITRGWASFCHGNGQEAGSYFIFKLVSNGTTPTLVLQKPLKEDKSSPLKADQSCR